MKIKFVTDMRTATARYFKDDEVIVTDDTGKELIEQGVAVEVPAKRAGTFKELPKSGNSTRRRKGKK